MANSRALNDGKDGNKDKMAITDVKSELLPQSTKDTEGGKQSSHIGNVLHNLPDAKDEAEVN